MYPDSYSIIITINIISNIITSIINMIITIIRNINISISTSISFRPARKGQESRLEDTGRARRTVAIGRVAPDNDDENGEIRYVRNMI